MTSKILGFSLAFGLAWNASAELIFYTGNASIADNDPNGYQDSRNLTGFAGVISDVNVTFSISGGFNGDLYAWLSHGSGLAILLNRVGVSSASAVGYSNPGFGADGLGARFTLDDQASQDMHFYGAGAFTLNGSRQLTGTWQPDGRILNPASAGSLFDTAPRPNPLGVFNGLDPNGEWTLFVADLSSGGVSTITDWGLQIEVVPEPSVLSLLSAMAIVLRIAVRRSRTQ